MKHQDLAVFAERKGLVRRISRRYINPTLAHGFLVAARQRFGARFKNYRVDFVT